jgi:hypothetical protein
MTNYTYRVYNGFTGHEYGDTDSSYTAVCLAWAISEYQGIDHNQLTIDVLVQERADA